MSARAQRWAPVALAAILPWLLLWPLPLVFGRELITSPLSEGPAHLWGWFAAWHERAPFLVRTHLLNFPDGLSFELIDPLHALPYALGALWSPAAGFNLVLVWGLFVAGLAGALLAREAGADTAGQLLGVCVGASAPTSLAVAVDGITEGLGVGWVGVQLAILLSMRRGATGGRALALAGAIAAGVLSGPYNAVWIFLIDIPVGLVLLRRTRAPLLSAAIATLLCAPYLHALASRDAGLPGGEARAGLGIPRLLDPWRAAGERGVDLLDLFVPAPLTGAASDLPHTGYLGVLTLGLAVIGASRAWRRGERRALLWALGAALFASLALGPWISVGGAFPTVGGRALLGPAGLLAWLTPLGRLTRWYRAAAVAALLLVPLATRAARGRTALLLAPLVLLDARLLAPLPWALPRTDGALPEALAPVDGPLAELPSVVPMFFTGETADQGLISQAHHRQPTNGTLHSFPGAATHADALRVLRRIAVNQAAPDDSAPRAAAELAGMGYRYLAVYRSFFVPEGLDLLALQLGPPLATDDRLLVWRISPARP